METVKPDLWLVAVDETEFFTDEYKKIGGKIAAIYLVDASVHTHICSFTPSLFLHYIDFATSRYLSDEDYDKFMEAFGETDSDYFGTGVMMNPHKLNITDLWLDEFPGYDDSDEYDEWIDDILENYRCNDHSGEVLGWNWFEMDDED